ncbi:MAG: indolepyruvate oxidoreductase subunit beta [Candidatus Thorarchaeota archaeon]|nr:indolepyruvate oxidoreductase subunit beta [Candidatus Thorarchaeota archaeon]
MPLWRGSEVRDPYSILVAGVGGQGNLVCGRIIAEATVSQGLRPVVGDTFGASRRGGSVVSHIRIGKQDWGPLIPKGEVDVLIGFEPVEALRAATRYASEKTIAIVSATPVPPSNVTSGNLSYPKIEDILHELETVCQQVYMLNTSPVLEKIGSTRVLNSYMVGALSAIEEVPLDSKNLRQAVLNILDSDNDLTAFDEGAKALH